MPHLEPQLGGREGRGGREGERGRKAGGRIYIGHPREAISHKGRFPQSRHTYAATPEIRTPRYCWLGPIGIYSSSIVYTELEQTLRLTCSWPTNSLYPCTPRSLPRALRGPGWSWNRTTGRRHQPSRTVGRQTSSLVPPSRILNPLPTIETA